MMSNGMGLGMWLPMALATITLWALVFLAIKAISGAAPNATTDQHGLPHMTSRSTCDDPGARGRRGNHQSGPPGDR